MSTTIRTTQHMFSTTLLSDLQRTSSAMARTQAQISSGQRIRTAGDDPVGAGRALQLRSQLSSNDGYAAAAEAAAGWTQTTESALSSIVDLVQSARELIVQGGNDTLQTTDRQKLGQKLTQVLEQMKASANARYGDQYVLSGQLSNVPPYQSGGTDTFSGDTGAVIRTIGPNQPVQVNVTGDAVLGGTAGDGKLLDTLRLAISNLNGGTPADLASLRGTVLQRLNSNLDSVLTARAQVGSVAARAELAAEQIDDLNLAATGQLSAIVDTDFAEAVTQLTSQKTVYQAALQAGASIIQPSLMDFLR